MKPGLVSLSGQSGRGRPRWDSSCWRKLGITRPCRGCSRPRTSTRRAWCPTWTPERPSISTGGPRRLRRPCRDPLSRVSCCTACKGAASHHLRRLPCPPCPACFLGRLSSGEPAPAEFCIVFFFFFPLVFLFFCTPAFAALNSFEKRSKDKTKKPIKTWRTREKANCLRPLYGVKRAI